MKRTIACAAGAGFLLILAVGAYAHEGATGVVKERMELMKDIAAAMKVLAPMAQGAVEWDAQAAAKSAGVIANHAKAMPEKFPKGSTDHPSEAKMEIWTKWDEFTASAEKLESSAQALKDSAANGAETAKPLFQAMVQSCKGCHEPFRAKKQ